MAVSQKCLDRCLVNLLDKRKTEEEKVKSLAATPAPVQSDYDKGIGFSEAMALATANYNTAFHRLRKTNLRIEAIKTGTFLGVCSKCGHNIEEQILLDNPMRDSCVDCQKQENGKRK